MKTTVDFSDFRHAFDAIRPDSFSREGIEMLFDYLSSYEEDGNEELELDVIAFCCEYAEQHWSSIASDYSIDIDVNENDDEQKQQVMNYLCDNTSVIGETKDGSFVYQQF